MYADIHMLLVMKCLLIYNFSSSPVILFRTTLLQTQTSQTSVLMQTWTGLIILNVLPGGPGTPGGPGKNMGDARIFSLVICSGTSALLDSMAI